MKKRNLSSERSLLIERYELLIGQGTWNGLFRPVTYLPIKEFRALSVIAMHREVNRVISVMNKPV